MTERINWPLLREGVAIVCGIPEPRVNLRWIVRDLSPSGDADCGTVCCAIGWMGLHPKFNGLGVKSNGMSSLTINGRTDGYFAAARHLFNLDAHESAALFAPAGHSKFDASMLAERDMSDLQRFKRRVVLFFREHNQPIDPQFVKEAGL